MHDLILAVVGAILGALVTLIFAHNAYDVGYETGVDHATQMHQLSETYGLVHARRQADLALAKRGPEA